MVTDAGATADVGAEAEAETVSMADFKKFQSVADQKAAAASRERAELLSVNDELHETVAALQEQMAQLQERSYDSDDPQVAALRKEIADAKKAARDADARFKQFAPRYRDTLLSYHATRVTGQTTGEQFNRVKAALSANRTDLAIEEAANNLLASGLAPAARRSSGSGDGAAPEVDAGRGAARGGTPKITRDFLNSISGDPVKWREHLPAISKAMAENGGVLPDR